MRRENMKKELKPDFLFQVLLKSFYLALGIENLSQINTELKEILAASVRIDAIVTDDNDFDFTKLRKRIFPGFDTQATQPKGWGRIISSSTKVSLIF